MDFPGGSDGKESAFSAGDPCSRPGPGRLPGEGNDNPLLYSCLENSMDRGDWTENMTEGLFLLLRIRKNYFVYLISEKVLFLLDF